MPFVERNRGGGLLGFRPLGYKDGGNANPSLWERYIAAQRGEDPPKKELKWKYGDRTMPPMGMSVSEQNAAMRSGDWPTFHRVENIHPDLRPKLDFLDLGGAKKIEQSYETYLTPGYIETLKELNSLMYEGVPFDEALVKASENLSGVRSTWTPYDVGSDLYPRSGLLQVLAREGDEQFLKGDMDASTAYLELEQALREKFFREERPVDIEADIISRSVRERLRKDIPPYRENQEVLDEREEYRTRKDIKKALGGLEKELMATGYFSTPKTSYPWREEYNYQNIDPVMMPDEARAAMRLPAERNRGGLMSLRRR